MTKTPLLLTVMIADANRVSSKTLQRMLEGKPNVAKAEVINQPGNARRAFAEASFNCLFVDIFSFGVDAGIELIQHVEAACPDAPICLYSEPSSLITMPDVSEAWRKRFGHYFKLGKDQVTQWSGPEVDTLLGALESHLRKALAREQPAGSSVLTEPTPSPQPAASTALVEPLPPKPAPPSPDPVKETPQAWEVPASAKVLETPVQFPTRPVSDRVFEPTVRFPSRPMLSRVAYGIEILSPTPRARTGRAFDITGTYTSLPAGHHIWIATVEERDLLSPSGVARRAKHYRPLEEASAKVISKWYAHIDYINGKPADFKTLVIFVVGRNGQVLFDYFKRAGSEARKLLAKRKTTKSLVEGNLDRLPALMEFTDDVVECASILITL